MRDPDSFRRAHAKLVRAALARGGEDDGELRNLGLFELCLHFLARHLPRAGIDAGPYLLLGYHGLVRPFAEDGAVLGPLANLRHLASRLASVAAWEDALRTHSEAPAAARCYDVAECRPVRRRTASPTLLASLDGALDTPVPWRGQTLHVAEPGEYRVRSKGNQSVLSYKVPPVAVPSPERHTFQTRPTNPPIILSMADLQAAAAEADAREAAPGWPRHEMKPLDLARRLVPVRINAVLPGFWDNATERLTLDGATHLVGMLSSGKSTLVWALLFALVRRPRPYRVAVLATDTVGAADLVARLRLHGVRATVLSSASRRGRHLESIHWQQKMRPEGATLATVGSISGSFGTACPLDGFQQEAKVMEGVSKGSSADFPPLKDKPCHALIPVSTPTPKAEQGDGTQGKREDPLRADVSEPGRSCPFWSRCPIQSQQREAVAAEVIAITPEAFAHMSPDRWVSDRRVTIPELLQFTADLVIVDEVDAMQKRLDGVFSPLSSIMGDERGMFAPFVGRQTSEALRKR